MYDTFCMDLFCCYERKSFLKIKAHLVAKTTDGTGTGGIMFLNTCIKNMLKKIEVLLHGRKLTESHEQCALR